MSHENEVDHTMTDNAHAQIKSGVGKKPVSGKPVASAKAIIRSSSDKSKILDRIADLIGGGQQTLNKALQQTGISKRTYYSWKKAALVQAPAEANAPLGLSEEIAQLEAENKRYRKMLADRLRVENAELRKRLAS